MIRAAVCDDEIKVRLEMEEILRDYPKEEIQVELFDSGEALLRARAHFDVIFLDIDMAGLNGIGAAKQIRLYDKKVKIIYLTNYRDYVGSAFAVHAFGYLLKPAEKQNIYAQLSDVLDYRVKEGIEKELEFDTTEGKVHLAVNNILYFEYQNRSILIHTGEREYQLRKKMTELAAEMEGEGFAMPHKSFCVNLYQVKKIKGYEIEMMNEDIIPLSQKKSVEFRRLMNEFAAGQIR